MVVRTRAWLVCDICEKSTAYSGQDTIAEARADVKGLWARRLNGKNGDFCSECKKAKKAAQSDQETEG